MIPAIHMSVFSWNFASSSDYATSSSRGIKFWMCQSSREKCMELSLRQLRNFPETIRVQPLVHQWQMLPSCGPDGFFSLGVISYVQGRWQSIWQTGLVHQELGCMSFGLASATNFLCGHGQTTLSHKAFLCPPVR